MSDIEKKDVIETCPIHPLEFFTECIEVGVEVKVEDTSALIRAWICK